MSPHAGRPGLVLALAALLSFPTLAHAADDAWGFSVAPYGWLLSLDGEVGVDGTATDVDLPFRDALSNLDFGFMGVLEAQHGRWFGSLDLLVAQLDADARFGPTNAEAALDQWLTKLDLVGGYRVLEHPLGSPGGPRQLTVDAYLGGRLWAIDTDIELDSPILGDRRASSDTWWIDPLIGVRLRGDLSESVVLEAVGDIGGFGIGSASEFSWGLQATLSYRINPSWALSAGYRVIAVDRERGVDGFDGRLGGPILGAVYMWGEGTR